MPRRFHARAPIIVGLAPLGVGDGETGIRLSGAPTMRHGVTGRDPCTMAGLACVNSGETVGRASPSYERIDMHDAGKPLEVAVCGVDLAALFDGQRCEMGVGGQSAGQMRRLHEFPEDRPMPWSGSEQRHRWKIEPLIYVCEG